MSPSPALLTAELEKLPALPLQPFHTLSPYTTLFPTRLSLDPSAPIETKEANTPRYSPASRKHSGKTWPSNCGERSGSWWHVHAKRCASDAIGSEGPYVFPCMRLFNAPLKMQ